MWVRTCSRPTDLAAAVLDSEVTLIAVGTPFSGTEIDLTAVLGATRQIGAALKEKSSYHLVVVKSTVVPGHDRSARAACFGSSLRETSQQGFLASA